VKKILPEEAPLPNLTEPGIPLLMLLILVPSKQYVFTSHGLLVQSSHV